MTTRNVEAEGLSTIAGYWFRHGYSQTEAIEIERDQIQAQIEEDDAMDLMYSWQ